MLENIHIENFRCFEDFKAEGFERINLIGGKNNSGKTCLLEGIMCLSKGRSKENILTEIALLRNERVEDLVSQDLRIGVKVEGIVSVSANQWEAKNALYSFNTELKKNEEVKTWFQSDLNIAYISQTNSLPDIDFDDIFYRVEVEERTKEFLDILMEIDPSITHVRTIGRDGMRPRIKQLHNRNYINLNSFGDAIKSVMRYFSPIIEREVFEKDTSKEYILLIDEIENGLHYTAYYEFWKKIFAAAKKLNIQIFATTHSKEMIEQFNIVSKEFEVINGEKTSAYFEMMRNVRTNKIVAQKYEAQELEYSLENEKTFRGE